MNPIQHRKRAVKTNETDVLSDSFFFFAKTFPLLSFKDLERDNPHFLQKRFERRFAVLHFGQIVL
jgi:hypothetical protein